MITKIKNKLISLIQLFLVVLYIIFEELVWETIAKPIYEAIHSLKILQKFEQKLQKLSPFLILMFFLVLLIVVEGVGLYAGVLFVSGHVLLGLSIYIAKIPIAAFTFWLFRVTEDKLMQFSWFKWLYTKVMNGISWLKSNKTYIKMMERLKKIKLSFKAWKERTFGIQPSSFRMKMKQVYNSIKSAFRK